MIRALTSLDLEDVQTVFYEAFSQDEARLTYSVIRELITEHSEPESLCLGYVVEDAVAAAVAFSPVQFSAESLLSAYILAPLATHPKYQKQGFATSMIRVAIEHLTRHKIDAVLVYGDPNYYQQYGFRVELGQHFVPPYPLQYEFGWQALMLSDAAIKGGPHRFSCVAALSDPSLW